MKLLKHIKKRFPSIEKMLEEEFVPEAILDFLQNLEQQFDIIHAIQAKIFHPENSFYKKYHVWCSENTFKISI